MRQSNFEEVIREKGQLIYTNVGNSMAPLIRPRDLLVIKKVTAPLKQYDIPLYKRKSGQYVLHRIVGEDKEGFITCGDNRTTLEYGVKKEQIIGVLTDIIRDGRTLSVDALSQALKQQNVFAAHDTIEYRSTLLSLDGSDSKRAKLRYCRKRVFPDQAYLKKHYPTVSRHKALYPLLLLYRPIKGVLTHPKGIVKEAKKIAGFKKSTDR